MNFLKIIVTCFALQILLTAECCLNRKRNAYGLFVPKIDRTFIPQGRIIDITNPKNLPEPKFQTVEVKELAMYHLLPTELGDIPIIMYVKPQFDFGSKFKPQYNFKLNKFTPKNSRQIIYAVELESDINTSKQSHLDTHAYWCPQGKFVDIPIHPKSGDAKYVFTPTFTGCAFVVDLLEKFHGGRRERFYRVYHVQGGKEDREYNHLRDHGMGMVTSMEYRHYGYFRPDIRDLNMHIQNVIGTAFMAYIEKQKKWVLYHQSQFGPKGFLIVTKIFVEKGKKMITASIPQNTYVPKSNILSVRSALGETADCGLATLHTFVAEHAPIFGENATVPVYGGLVHNDYDCSVHKEISEGTIVVYFRCRKIF